MFGKRNRDEEEKGSESKGRLQFWLEIVTHVREGRAACISWTRVRYASASPFLLVRILPPPAPISFFFFLSRRDLPGRSRSARIRIAVSGLSRFTVSPKRGR